ncbi:hypothetical protein, partial [Moorena sp. SIO4A1]|uniref:hypothetical protein n=1 Tax=Moorena sp. SIO4A1 TaxID=2607835 RepID=UPI0025ECE16D
DRIPQIPCPTEVYVGWAVNQTHSPSRAYAKRFLTGSARRCANGTSHCLTLPTNGLRERTEN